MARILNLTGPEGRNRWLTRAVSRSREHLEAFQLLTMPKLDPQTSECYIPPVQGANKRDAERIPILGELHGEVMVFQPMLVRDVSSGGVTVETRFPLQIDSLHDVRLTLGPRSVVVKGRVVHSRISDVDQDAVAYRTGLEFVEPSQAVLGAIVEFLDAVKATRSGV